MKKVFLTIVALLLVICLCSCGVQSGDEPSSEPDSANNAVSVPDDEILVGITYDKVNKDFSVYTPEFFGKEYSSCKIYDLFGGHALYMILKVKDSDVKNIDKLISQLNDRDDVLFAEKNNGENTKDLTEYVPGKVVHLLNRRYPFSKEYTGYEYDRSYRLLYYDNVNFNDLVPQELDQEWWEYYVKLNEWEDGGQHKKEAKEMSLVSFIKYCNIPREAMEAKIAEYEEFKAVNGDSFGYYTEAGELPNFDIIYTFDNEIINEYYRYK